ncbi:VP2 protein [Bluetongue virus 11]|uniref:Outer capsid protein VP2 n=1 Tax=Bluetongue virus 11 TaxID=35329 RepID=A0A0G3Y2X3_BTV|nr:VP2 protein [Bluetongue virus 11]
MEEFVIPVFSETEIPYSLLSHYPLAVRTDVKIADVDEGHDVVKIPESDMIDVPRVSIVEALAAKPTRNDGIVVPRLLDITLRAYDDRKAMKSARGVEFMTNAKWMKWAIDDRMDIQPLKVAIDDHNAVNHQLFNCIVKARSANADTIYYDYFPLENKVKKCNHTNLDLLRSLTTTEMFHMLQGAAYSLKSSYELITNSERNNTEETYAPGVHNRIRLVRGTRIGYKGEAYSRFVSSLVQVRIQGRTPPEIVDDIARLNEIRTEWINAQFDSTKIRALELCKILSAIGRKMLNTHEEPKDEMDLSMRFQFKLDDKFKKTDSEHINIFNAGAPATHEGRFYALIAIAATDTQRGRVWRTNPYPCLRGALIAAECQLGDVYHTLRQVYKWSLRQDYGRTEVPLENNKYVFSRINLFDSNLEVGDQVVHWKYEIDGPAETTYDNGYICKTEREDGELVCKISEEKYKTMLDRMIQGGWDQERFKLYSVLTDPNLLTIDFEKDAYLNIRSEFVLPSYFDQWIYSPMFNARLRITHGEIGTRKSADPWNKRVVFGYVKASTESPEYALGQYFDTRIQLYGDALSLKQNQSAVFQHQSQQEDFPVLTGYAKGDVVCPHSGGALYTFRKVALMLMANYEKLSPDLHEGMEDHTYTHPSIGGAYQKRILEMRDFSQLICFIIDYIFERHDQLRDMREARRILYLIQSLDEPQRLDMLNVTFPNFFRYFLKLKDVQRISDLNVINFLPLLFLIQDNISYWHRQWAVPMILYDDTIKLIPVEVGAYANRFGIKSFFNFTRFHPGDAKKRQKADDTHKEFGLISFNYYASTKIAQGGVHTPVVTTKLDTLKIHLSSLCAGLADSVVYTLPVAHPKKCIVLIIVGDDKLEPHVRSEQVVSKYYFSRKHVGGVVSICVGQNDQLKVYSSGIVRHRICEKFILRYKCKVVLVKMPGYVFGNDELMTKLLNV